MTQSLPNRLVPAPPSGVSSYVPVPADDFEEFYAASYGAPYVVLPWGRGGLQVRDVFTGTHLAFVPPLPGQYLVGVAGAEDDRTFVVWAEMGGRTQGGIGIRVLDVTAPGTLLGASRLVVSYGRFCAAYGGCQDGPVITPDGSTVIVPKAVQEGSVYTDSVVEYSTRTGQALASVAPPVSSAFPGTLCVPLWTDPSGEQVVTSCGHPEKYDHGHVTPITLHPPMNGTDILFFAWQPGSTGI
jgi:hypothetical protein